MILLEYQNIKTFLQKAIWSEEVFVIKKVKNTLLWTYVITDLNGAEMFETFCKKTLQKTNQKEFSVEKAIKRKSNKLINK